MKEIREVEKFLKSEFNEKIGIAIILGSGLSNLTMDLEIIKEIDFEKIPHFTKSNIIGHDSKIILAKYKEKIILALKGRFHFYEGYDISKVVLPVRVFALLGIKNLIVTNACGGISDYLNPGDIMLIEDQISMFCPSPLRGENINELGTRFPDMTEAYNKDLLEKTLDIASKNNILLKKGIYAFFQGPMYETPAEIRAYKNLGADAIGMSTVPEVIAANHANIKVLGISLITNKAAGLGGKLSHNEVLEIAQASENKLKELVKLIIEKVF
ncbi:purine-nucleoside phosphorylase [Spiroplasma taiwanense]|uniref:Purine nucleoside phosphorylase n=1 Tax=Spiroplasma taiwanense CT-1 TaxID=1276220 RepID=S5LSY4_9MOLU|nr:purine-nucleoside phosphorylase [Spiroplasma taiwanense]AGR40784.1 purine nucleoside phosphorylase [Spiroplasma taiwanense CT-1]